MRERFLSKGTCAPPAPIASGGGGGGGGSREAATAARLAAFKSKLQAAAASGSGSGSGDAREAPSYHGQVLAAEDQLDKEQPGDAAWMSAKLKFTRHVDDEYKGVLALRGGGEVDKRGVTAFGAGPQLPLKRPLPAEEAAGGGRGGRGWGTEEEEVEELAARIQARVEAGTAARMEAASGAAAPPPPTQRRRSRSPQRG